MILETIIISTPLNELLSIIIVYQNPCDCPIIELNMITSNCSSFFNAGQLSFHQITLAKYHLFSVLNLWTIYLSINEFPYMFYFRYTDSSNSSYLSTFFIHLRGQKNSIDESESTCSITVLGFPNKICRGPFALCVRWDGAVCFLDIAGIVDHHFLNFLFMKRFTILIIHLVSASSCWRNQMGNHNLYIEGHAIQ